MRPLFSHKFNKSLLTKIVNLLWRGVFYFETDSKREGKGWRLKIRHFSKKRRKGNWNAQLCLTASFDVKSWQSVLNPWHHMMPNDGKGQWVALTNWQMSKVYIFLVLITYKVVQFGNYTIYCEIVLSIIYLQEHSWCMIDWQRNRSAYWCMRFVDCWLTYISR